MSFQSYLHRTTLPTGILFLACILGCHHLSTETEANDTPPGLSTSGEASDILEPSELDDRNRIYESINPANFKEISSSDTPSRNIKGWGHLRDLLLARGFPRGTLVDIFSDARMPAYKTLKFSVQPREPRDIYRRRDNSQEAKNALKFYNKHAQIFRDAEARFGVDRSIILALSLIHI